MKKLTSAFMLVAGLALSSCDNNKTETSETTATMENTAATDTMVTPSMDNVANVSATEGKSTTMNTADLPAPVSTTFTKKYPKAERVVWMQYEPIEYDNMAMDRQYYYVKYYTDGSDYISWYDNNGEWVRTSTKMENTSGLPDPVNATIKTQYPGYTISEVDKENDKDREMYEIELNKGDSKVKLKILPNGEIFKKKS
ncbi:MAG: PepSY-like domain-containing protein [Ferruginibacter sp.]